MKNKTKYFIASIIGCVIVAVIAQFELNLLCNLANGHYDSTKKVCLEQSTYEELYFITNGVFFLVYVLVFLAVFLAVVQFMNKWFNNKV